MMETIYRSWKPPLNAYEQKRSDRVIARVICAKVLLKFDLLSNSKAEKIGYELLQEAYYFGLAPWTMIGYLRTKKGKALLNKAISYYTIRAGDQK